MKKPHDANLTRRERQIMDVLYEKGEATAAEVRSGLPDPPSYSTVRALLAKLEAKGHIRHHENQLRYVYTPTVPQDEARDSALHRVVKTFFDGSVTHAVNSLLGMSAGKLPSAELDRLAEIIADAKQKGEE